MQKRVTISVLLIVFLSLAVFCSKIYGQFLADDFTILSRVSDFLSEKSLIRLGLYGFYYRPVPPMVWIPLYKFFGLSAVYYHAVHLILHIINSLLIYFLLSKAFEERTAFISACIFSVITVHLEAVQWVCIIFDVLCAQFFLLSVLLLVFFLERRRFPFYFASLVTAILAIFSKENAITLPLIFLAFSLIWFWKKGFNPKSVLSSLMLSLPPFLLYAFYIIVRSHFLKGYGIRMPSLSSLLNPAILSNYTDLFSSLIVPYYGSGSISEVQLFAMSIFSITVILCFYWIHESRRVIVFGLIWILVTALPTLVVIDVGPQRFNYLPSVGFCAIIGEILVLSSAVLRKVRLAPLLPCTAIALYSINTIFHNDYWMEAWRTSKEIQRSFQTEVEPVLEKPARVYFFQIPEMVNDISYFTVGLPECFSLLSKEKAYHYYVAVRWTRPNVPFPEKSRYKEDISNYYCFEWDSSNGRFLQVGDVFRDSQPSEPGKNAVFSWDFSRYRDFDQWEPANDLSIVFDRKAGSYKFLTTGNNSFLKSPYINRRIKYVQISCRTFNRRKTPLRGQLFWVTENDISYDGKKSITFPLKNDDLVHTYTVPLYINAWSMREPILRLALRLSNRPETLIDMRSATIYSY